MQENEQKELQKTKKFKFDYSWVIIGICFLTIATSMGLCSSGRTMYLTAITDALGLKRGAFSLNDTCRFVTTMIVNLYFGKLTRKFGTKKLICAGFISLMAFAYINSVATELYQFYIGSVFLGIGLSWTTTTMTSTIINRWCKKNKGTITGATLAANGIGGAIAVQIISPIIFEEGNPFGYRNSYRLVCAILLAMLLIVLLFFHDKPKGETKKTVAVDKKRKVRGTGWVGMDYETAVRKPYFYVALLCMALTGFCLQGIGGIATPHLYDVGIKVELVALIGSISSIFLTIGKFTTGFLYDRLGMRITMNISFVCTFVSLFGLIFVSNTPFGEALAFIRAPFTSFAFPLETVMLPLFASELFGNKDFDRFVGLFVSASAFGFAFGSPFGNILHDITGSYNIAFLIFGIMMIFVTIAMQFVLKSANRDRKKILAKEEAEKLI